MCVFHGWIMINLAGWCTIWDAWSTVYHTFHPRTSTHFHPRALRIFSPLPGTQRGHLPCFTCNWYPTHFLGDGQFGCVKIVACGSILQQSWAPNILFEGLWVSLQFRDVLVSSNKPVSCVNELARLQMTLVAIMFSTLSCSATSLNVMTQNAGLRINHLWCKKCDQVWNGCNLEVQCQLKKWTWKLLIPWLYQKRTPTAPPISFHLSLTSSCSITAR